MNCELKIYTNVQYWDVLVLLELKRAKLV